MTIRSVGIVGGGTMGAGIAQSAIVHGFAVALVDVDAAAAARGRDSVAEQVRKLAAKGRLDDDAETVMARLQPSGRIEDVAGRDLVIEAVFEDFAVKERLFSQLDDAVGPDTLVATNTSSYRVDDLAKSISHPERFLGMHYFVPAGINKLVEVARGAATDPAAIEAAAAFARATGKEPLLCRDSNGFVVNRYFIPFFNEAVRLFDEGVLPGQIDEVARAVLRSAVGPFFVMNLSKPRICLHSCRTLERFGAFYAPAPGIVRQGEADRPFDIVDGPALDGTAREAVADRLRAAIFLPVLELLDEGVTEPAGVDLGAKLALRWDDPPCRMMDDLGRAEVERMVGDIAARFGATVPKTISRVGRLVS